MADNFKKIGELVDTNVLIDYYDTILEEGELIRAISDEMGGRYDVYYVILMDVLKEMDKLEHETRNKGLKYSIRQAKNTLRHIVDNSEDFPGIMFIDWETDQDYVDDTLLYCLKNPEETQMFDELSLLTGDTTLYIRATLEDLPATLLPKNYRKETYKDLRYNPVVTLNPEEHSDEITAIYQDGGLPDTVEMLDGQYLEIEDLEGEIKGQFRHVEGSLEEVGAHFMRVQDFTTVNPKNSRQNLFIDLLKDESTPVKLVTGAQGVGKTYFSLLYAYNRLKEQQKRIIWMRPTVYVRDTQDIGALPGDLEEKLAVMYAPAKDILSEHVVQDLVESGEFCVEHLGYDRGRSFTNATILITECQNLTKDNVHFILGRVGEGTEIIFDGDYMQSDIGHPTGLLALDETLAGNPLFGKIELPDTVRSEVAKLTQLFEE